ncbi:class I SAM-dependent methyltransferase [Bacillus sp. MUM 13]|uniref:class I SAM-dependent methyltransferase n=1 Tax=Bacillus sp. MUM 13 TaxID=1678001 RepID=UPI0008F573BF|nr:class I SAM-dependent methyltransferase [Bacillus sp. MUM 13]OIK06810.1 hypothetical protein BIV59_21310 [Bacillus sp. MUM 13]
MVVKENTLEYFKVKADKYDLVEDQKYWQLSDRILWDCLTNVLDKFPENFTFLDAGGGTGRWSLKVLEAYPKSKGYTFDLSDDMLGQAKQKRTRNELDNRWEIYQGDLHNISSIPDEVVDVSFNFHNVLGFVENPTLVIAEIQKKVKKNGYLISFVPSQYHSIFFNISIGKIDEAQKAASGKGRFTSEMPYIHMFTPENLTDLYQENGLVKESMVGFPIFIYPGYQETQLEGETKVLKDILSIEQNLEDIYTLEKQFLSEATISRGNNLFIVGKKK